MNMRQEQSGEFERLLERLLNDQLVPTERRQLAESIAGNAALRRTYLEHCQLHAMLKAHAGAFDAETFATRPPVVERRESSVSCLANAPATKATFLRKAAFIGLVSLSAAVLAAFAFWPERAAQVPVAATSPTSPGPVIARVSQLSGARFVSSAFASESPGAEAGMRSGHYQLETGLATFDYASGAQVLAQAPVCFKLVDTNSIELLEGRLTVRITEASAGFTVTTPSVDVVDYGTEFGVAVERGKLSEVHVFEGEVEVKPRAAASESVGPLRLVTGQASRVDHSSGIPAGIDLAAYQFLRSLAEPESEYSRRILELKPAVYYRMEPADNGLTLLDASGSAAHGQIVAGRSEAEIWAKGKLGAALRLGGPALQRYGVVRQYPQTDSDKISVLAWVQANSRPRWATIAKNWANEERGQFHFGLRFDSGELEAHIREPNGTVVHVIDNVPLPLHEWHHVAMVADGEKLHLYRNGQEVSSFPYRGLNRNPLLKALGIGAKLNDTADGPVDPKTCIWDGRLDELAIFNHALSADQIRELHTLCE